MDTHTHIHTYIHTYHMESPLIIRNINANIRFEKPTQPADKTTKTFIALNFLICIHTYIHTYIKKWIKYQHSYIARYMKYIPSHIRPFMHDKNGKHSYIHTYIHTHLLMAAALMDPSTKDNIGRPIRFNCSSWFITTSTASDTCTHSHTYIHN